MCIYEFFHSDGGSDAHMLPDFLKLGHASLYAFTFVAASRAVSKAPTKMSLLQFLSLLYYIKENW